jgi:hypothetical protein
MARLPAASDFGLATHESPTLPSAPSYFFFARYLSVASSG